MWKQRRDWVVIKGFFYQSSALSNCISHPWVARSRGFNLVLMSSLVYRPVVLQGHADLEVIWPTAVEKVWSLMQRWWREPTSWHAWRWWIITYGHNLDQPISWRRGCWATIKFPTSPVPDIVLSQGDSFVCLCCCIYGRMMPSFYYFITFTTTPLPPTLPSFSLLLHIMALCTRQPARWIFKSETSDAAL